MTDGKTPSARPPSVGKKTMVRRVGDGDDDDETKDEGKKGGGRNCTQVREMGYEGRKSWDMGQS